MRKSKPTMISLTDEHKEKARKLSLAILGKESLSGLVTYLINKEGNDTLHVGQNSMFDVAFLAGRSSGKSVKLPNDCLGYTEYDKFYDSKQDSK